MKRIRFTLTEIIVALGVFSILAAIMLRFFSGAQTLISVSETRNEVYNDARVALDLMANLLEHAAIRNATEYNSGIYPFRLERGLGPNGSDRIYFYSFAPSPLVETTKGNTGTTAVMFAMAGKKAGSTGGGWTDITPGAADEKTWNPLILVRFGDNDNDHPLFDALGTGIFDTALYNALCNQYITYATAANTDAIRVVNGVVKLEFRPYHLESAAGSLSLIGNDTNSVVPADGVNRVPDLIEIRLTMLDRKNYLAYLGLGGNIGSAEAEPAAAAAFRQAHERTFTRCVLLKSMNYNP